MGKNASNLRLSARDGKPLRLLVFVGTRPEAVKLVPIVLAAREFPDIDVRVVSSGQHPNAMLEVLEHFEVGLDGDVALFQHGQTLADITIASLRGFTFELEAEEPDVVVVQGDTTTAFAGALAAFYLQVPVAHVEAGLRTHELLRPYPEELNRRLIDALSSYLFPPTSVAARNLAAEGREGDDVFVTGNTIVDSLNSILDGRRAALPREVSATLDDLRWQARVLVTAHRRESWGGPMDEIAAAIAELARRFPATLFLLPVHPNPIVRRSFARRRPAENVLLVEPLGYAQFIAALQRADLVLTDSGGVLEEATVLGKRVLIMRERTERPEAVAAEIARVVGVSRAGIVSAAAGALEELRLGVHPNGQGVFGDGRAGERTVRWLRWRHGLDAIRPAPFTGPEACAPAPAAALPARR
jgi:UDP-N-acetylglucosamine 2-epimerase (non-hydrolysing)